MSAHAETEYLPVRKDGSFGYDPTLTMPGPMKTITPSDAYPMSDADRMDLARRFVHHPPKRDQIDRYQDIRAAGLAMAELIVTAVPSSRERSKALSRLEESIMYANAGIARNE